MAERSSTDSDCEYDPTHDEPENESDFSDSECEVSDGDEDGPEPADQADQVRVIRVGIELVVYIRVIRVGIKSLY